MGWADCGTDSRGRPIGYAVEATCDHPGCGQRIHRGLPFVCGTMHGEEDYACEGYFCEKHRQHWLPIHGKPSMVCAACHRRWKAYAIERPEDAASLIAFFEEDEGEGWRDCGAEKISGTVESGS